MIMALMGVLQLAFLVRFLSRPALSGVLAIIPQGRESACHGG